jgi:hypothetical protein
MIAEEKLCANSSMKISPDLAGKKKRTLRKDIKC